MLTSKLVVGFAHSTLASRIHPQIFGAKTHALLIRTQHAQYMHAPNSCTHRNTSTSSATEAARQSTHAGAVLLTATVHSLYRWFILSGSLKHTDYARSWGCALLSSLSSRSSSSCCAAALLFSVWRTRAHGKIDFSMMCKYVLYIDDVYIY